MSLPLLNNELYDFENQCIKMNINKNCCLVVYDQEAKSELFESFLNDFTSNRPDVKNTLQEFFGTALTGNRWTTHPCLWLHGQGDNGKSTFINLMNYIFNHFACFLNKNFTNELLEHKWLGIIEDDIDDENINHIINAENMSYINVLWKTITFKNNCHLVLITNHQINMNDKMIEIPCLWKGEKDVHLLEKLSQPDVLSAVLNWLIEGAHRAKTNGKIALPLNNYYCQLF